MGAGLFTDVRLAVGGGPEETCRSTNQAILPIEHCGFRVEEVPSTNPTAWLDSFYDRDEPVVRENGIGRAEQQETYHHEANSNFIMEIFRRLGFSLDLGVETPQPVRLRASSLDPGSRCWCRLSRR